MLTNITLETDNEDVNLPLKYEDYLKNSEIIDIKV